MRSVALAISILSLGVCQMAFAQAPDVRIKGDLSLGMVNQKAGVLGFRSYTTLGRFSTISLQTQLPIGFNVMVSQRLSVMPNDPDDDGFDEYYAEDPGSWRIGKQYLPFGGGATLRETALAARVDSSLLVEGLPLSVALVDQGAGRQFGVIGRLGSRGLGISLAVGRHWGINGTAFATVRSVGGALPVGSGWKQAFGVDWNRRFGKVSLRAEGVLMRSPETIESQQEVVDVNTIYDLGHKHNVSLGLSKILGDNDLWTRFAGVYTAAKGVQLEGMVRSRDGRFVDLSVMLRLRF